MIKPICLAVFTDGYHARLIEIRRIGLPAAEPILLEVSHCPRHQLPRW
uniref:GCN5-related N-acetyltransferase n=1 Tax=Rhizobium meliloti TaxID=382 RepID=I2E1H3_RHIML|nr:GCN5-related N-acetyltransferase [Sinorhizobium meliloti]